MGRVRFWALARRIAPIGAVAVLLASGCGLLPTVLGTPSFQAATLAPPDAWSFTSVTLRPSVQQALYARDVFNFYADLSVGGTSFSSLPKPSGGTVDFEKDVLPLLDGEVAVFLTGKPEQLQGVLLIHTNNPESVLRLLAEEAAPKFTRDARGAIRYTNGLSQAAGYKNWVTFAQDDATVTQTLDRIDGKGGPSLATQPRYQSAVQRLNGDYLGYGYLDITPLFDSPTFRDLQPDSALAARGRMAYSLAFGAGAQGGMRALDLRTEFIAETLPPPTAAERGDALSAMDLLPKGNAIAFSGSSIGQVAESLETLSEDVVPDDVLTLLRTFTGPYAVGVSPVSGGGLDATNFLASLFFLGQLAPDADEDFLREVIALAVEDADPNTAWQQQVVTDGTWTAVNIVPESVDLDRLDQNLLASDSLYQSVRPAFAQDGSNAYVNIGALLAWGQEQGATSEELAAFAQLRAIGTSWRNEIKGDGHGRLLVLIGS
jgi:hypothetical protein